MTVDKKYQSTKNIRQIQSDKYNILTQRMKNDNFKIQASDIFDSDSQSQSLSDEIQQQQQRGLCDGQSTLEERFLFQLAEEEEWLRLYKKQQPNPTDEEIQIVMQTLERHFTEHKAIKICKQLCMRLIPQGMHRSKRKIPPLNQASQEEIKEAVYLNSPISKVERNIATINSLTRYLGFKKVFLKSAWQPPLFIDPQEQSRYHIKCIVAKSYAYRGHSMCHFKQELAESGQKLKIQKWKYHPTLDAIIIEAYKFLERFLREECGIKIQILVRNELKVIGNRLFHCREALKKKQYTVFLEIVKLLYGLEDVTLDEYAAVNLYNITQRGLRTMLLKKIEEQPKKNKKADLSSQKMAKNEEVSDTKSILFEKTIKQKGLVDLQSIWTTKLQHQFIDTYKKIQFFKDIKKHFITKYPQYKHFFEGNGLHNRLNQILRVAMRKVRQIVASTPNSIQLSRLDDYRIKYVMKSSRSLRARLMLVDIYIDPSKVYNNRIRAVVQEINKAIADKPNYRFKQWSKSEANTEDDTSEYPQLHAPVRLKQYEEPPVRYRKMRGRKSRIVKQIYLQDQRKFHRIKLEQERKIEPPQQSIAQLDESQSSQSQQTYVFQKQTQIEEFDAQFYAEVD